MKFNVTQNMKYCLSHFIYPLISIYTYSSAWNFFMMSKQTEYVKKNDNLSYIGAWRICIMLHGDFTHIFKKKKKNIDISSESTVSLLFIYSEL